MQREMNALWEYFIRNTNPQVTILLSYMKAVV